MTPRPSPPSKPLPPGAIGANRTAVLNAARLRFAHENYDRVHLSEIALDADVDETLVEGYFGSKENLLAEVLGDAIYPSVLMDGDRSKFGRRLMSAFADGKPHDQELDYFLLLLRVAMVPALQPMLRSMLQNRLFLPFTAWMGGADAAVRARLVHTVLMGASMQAVLSDDVPMASGDKDRCRDFLARLLQDLIDGKSLDQGSTPQVMAVTESMVVTAAPEPVQTALAKAARETKSSSKKPAVRRSRL